LRDSSCLIPQVSRPLQGGLLATTRFNSMKGLGADKPYWDSLLDGKVRLQQCAQCRKWNWPAVFRCGDCGSWEHSWQEVEAAGKIFSWTRCWYDFGGPREYTAPFVSVVVELNNNAKTRLLGVLEQDDQEVRIGDPVTGRIAFCTFDNEQIPALRWTLNRHQEQGL
jgi:uncharacterized OB-fold protein